MIVTVNNEYCIALPLGESRRWLEGFSSPSLCISFPFLCVSFYSLWIVIIETKGFPPYTKPSIHIYIYLHSYSYSYSYSFILILILIDTHAHTHILILILIYSYSANSCSYLSYLAGWIWDIIKDEKKKKNRKIVYM